MVMGMVEMLVGEVRFGGDEGRSFVGRYEGMA